MAVCAPKRIGLDVPAACSGAVVILRRSSNETAFSASEAEESEFEEAGEEHVQFSSTTSDAWEIISGLRLGLRGGSGYRGRGQSSVFRLDRSP